MSNGYSNGPAVQRTDAAIDQGLRSFFLRTFNIMALGVALTGLVAWFVGSQYISTAMGESVALSGLIQVLYGTPLTLGVGLCAAWPVIPVWRRYLGEPPSRISRHVLDFLHRLCIGGRASIGIFHGHRG